MKSSKSIERLFQEGFKDFQASPSPKVWNGIEEKLTGKKHSRRILPFWWQVASVAAIVLIFSSIGVFYYNSSVYKPSITFKKPASLKSTSLELIPLQYRFSSVTESLSKMENSFESRLAFQIREPEAGSSVLAGSTLNFNQKDWYAAPAEKTKTTERSFSTVSQLKGSLINFLSSPSVTYSLAKADVKENTVSKKKSLFDAMQEDNLSAVDEAKSIDKPWTVQPNIAPVFMSSLSGGNPIESTLQGKTTSNPNLSYGVNVAYAINKKIKIRTGINQVAMGYATQDVVLSITSPSFKGENSSNINRQSSQLGQFSLISAINNRDVQTRAGITSLGLRPSKVNPVGVLNHELGFVEVPLEVEYALLDEKIGIHVLGGASTYVLNNNEIFFENNGRSSNIGEANNLNTFSFSANLGVGMDYNFSEQVSFNLEPKFMYQINTFESNTSSFQPYFFGIYSGIKFKF
ncbi:hypothetical protein [Psychroflexus sediminis]|uniref:Outer membrane protein beta-barrel domain-containing protein n=1 Tax=Psychroflexus sediminis TaxID=470826 RepID=A0A1G7YS65_9FLAO|nr:hypothetical protein [Psychroflexus sediminis]SDG99422.1 hypothetical protein SAMN04488027_11410 [Psychroflexus sediminis]